ncbi:MAG: glycosyltransferase involved in cell wall biosynthesis [Candidatus Krumholzibacteriia bacterium]|jgi:glycosyltransferase involved in cell wall biosynthesis
MSGAENPKKLLFLIPEDWYVCSHRLPLIEGAIDRGMVVTVVTRVDREKQPILDAGAQVIPSRLHRGFSNPVQDLIGFIHLLTIYRRERPDIVHHVTPKSCLYGSLAARLTGIKNVVNAMAGLGFLYTSSTWRARLVRPWVTLAFKLLHFRSKTRVIVQNNDDGDFFIQNINLDLQNLVLIRGSGVDTKTFKPVEREPQGKIRFCLVARMISEKGLFEVVAAARILQAERQDLEFVFAGEPDVDNPSGISVGQLQAWHDEGAITWLGRVSDVAALLNTCHVGLLPSYYREGFPKSLLEAAACGLPLLATDATGCREICQDGVNGVLVPVRDVASVVAAVKLLADDPQLRERYGRASRRLVEENFSETIVVEQTMSLYQELLSENAENV